MVKLIHTVNPFIWHLAVFKNYFSLAQAASGITGIISTANDFIEAAINQILKYPGNYKTKML
jgi:hypothetical protein